jgi:hypothetical protein
VHLTAVAVFLAVLPAFAQIHGTPPSITSFGATGIGFMPRPSITSLGPFGWQVPNQFFPNQPFFPGGVIPGLTGPFPGPFGVPFTGPFGGPFNGGNRPGVSPVVISAPYPVPYPVVVMGDPSDPADLVNGQDPRTTPMNYTPARNPNSAAVAPVPSLSGQAVGNPSPAAAPQPVADQQPTVLVFRNGKRLEVRNYAIVGNEIVNLSGTGPRKIAVSDLDLNATSRVNDDRAVNFRLPASSNDRDATKR